MKTRLLANAKLAPLAITPGTASSTPKRGRDSSTGVVLTMSNEPKTKRLANMATPTYSNVVSETVLTVAVIDLASDGTVVPLSDGRGDRLLKAQNDKTFDSLNAGVFLPAFDDTRDIGTAIRMKCTNAATRQWLVEATRGLTNMWRDANIVVIDYRDLPKPHKVNAWFPGCDKPTSQILRMLEALNSGLNTTSWSVIRRKASDKGLSLSLAIDDESLEALRSKNFKLYFGVVTAVFYLLEKKKQPNNTEVQTKEIEKMETDEATTATNAVASVGSTTENTSTATNFVDSKNETVVNTVDTNGAEKEEEMVIAEEPVNQNANENNV